MQGTSDKKKRQPTYYEALGFFATEFAMTESALFFLLIAKSKVTMKVAKAVFSGARIDTVIDFLKRIQEANTGSRELGGDLDDVLSRLKSITTVRNDILHYGTLDGDAFTRLVSNQFKALTQKHEKATQVTAQALMDMAADCQKITVHVLAAIMPSAVLDAFGGGVPPAMTQRLQSPWRYKPLQPSRPRSQPPSPKTPARGQRRSRQREASQV